MERLDRDGNRVLDPDELSQIQGPFRSMLEQGGVDLSRPIRTDDLMERMRQRMEQYRNGGDPSRPREESRDSDRSDRDRDRDRYSNSSGSSGSGGSGERRDDRRAESSRSTTGGKPKPLVKREKTRIPLPSEYTSGDADRDGQITLSEWKTWKGRAALSEFARLDRDSDGFLTPRELASVKGSATVAASSDAASPATPASDAESKVAGETASADTNAAPTMPDGTAATPGATGATPATTPGKTESSTGATAGSVAANGTSPAAPPAVTASPAASTPVEDSSSLTGETADSARRFFGILDRDRNKLISPQEWTASTRIRGMFNTGKVDLSQPMNERDFVGHYVRLTEAGVK